MSEEPAAGGAPAAAAAAAPAAAAPAPAAAAAAPAAVATPSWRESLPQEFRENPAFKNFENQDDVLRSYAHLRQLQGLPPERVAKRPGEDATPEEWSKYYEFNGRPAKADGYKMPKIEGMEFNEERAKGLQEKAHKLGLSQKQFSDLITDLGKDSIAAQTNANKEYNTRLEQTNAKLQDEWGAAFEDRANDIKSFLKSTGDTELQAELNAAGLGANERLMKFLGKVAGQWRETGAVGGNGGGNPNNRAMTAGDAKAEIAELEATPDFMKKYRAGDGEASAKMTRLYSYAFPEQKRQ